MLEVLVAMVILGLGLGGLAAGAGQAQRAAATAAGSSEAVVIAAGLVDRGRHRRPLVPEEGGIEPGGYRWRLRSEREAVPGLWRIVAEVDHPLGGTTATYRLIGQCADRPLALTER